MTAQDHVIAWIESSRPHYDRLLELYRRRQPECRDGFMRPTGAYRRRPVRMGAGTVIYSEAAYFDGQHCAHVAAWEDHKRVTMRRAQAAQLLRSRRGAL